MTEARRLGGYALALGVSGLLLIASGAALALFGSDDGSNGLAGVLFRVGALLGATALVLPTLRRPSLATIVVSIAGLALVLARPGLVWAALIGWAIWVVGRQRRTSSKQSWAQDRSETRTDSPGL